MAFLCFNVRGLNSLATQFEIRESVKMNFIDFFLLLETEIKAPYAQSIRDFFGTEFESLNNESENSPDPISMWVFWRKENWTESGYSIHNQFIHI